MGERAILHVDMDAFFAAVEVLDDPALRGKPVIVGGAPQSRGVVAAASYEARRFGVHSALPAVRAVKLCPHGVFLPPRLKRYAEVSRAIQSVFKEYTPLVEPISLDEAFLDVTGSRRLFGPAETIGRAIKSRIQAEIGLTASVGVAPNKFLAKLASDLEKPDGFVVIRRESAAALLASLPVARLWGVGEVTGGKLKRLGITTVSDLLAYPRDLLVARLGDHAEHLLALAVGHDERPVVPGQVAKSIGHEVTFATDVADATELREVLDRLSEKVGRRLRRSGLLARTVSLKARYRDFATRTRAVTLPQPTDATPQIRAAARELLERRLGRRGRRLRLLGVAVSNLIQPGQGQGYLFGDPASEHDRRIDSVLDAVDSRFAGKIQRGAASRRRRPQ